MSAPSAFERDGSAARPEPLASRLDQAVDLDSCHSPPVTYFVFVVCLLAMQPAAARSAVVADAGPDAAGAGLDAAADSSSGAGIGPAIRFVAGAPAILATTAMYMCLNISGGLSTVLIPIYARDVLGGGPATYGLLLSSLTAGELVGLLVIGASRWRWPLGRSIAAGATVSGVILSLLLLRPSLLPMIAIPGVSGLAESSLTPWAQTIRMRLIPPALRGRVFALLRTSMQSTRPIGSVLAGVLLAGGDLTPALVAIALLVLGPGAVGLWLPALGRAATAEPEPVPG